MEKKASSRVTWLQISTLGSTALLVTVLNYLLHGSVFSNDLFNITNVVICTASGLIYYWIFSRSALVFTRFPRLLILAAHAGLIQFVYPAIFYYQLTYRDYVVLLFLLLLLASVIAFTWFGYFFGFLASCVVNRRSRKTE